MGTWGTALYQDDLAADLRSEFRHLVGQGVSAHDALDRLQSEYASCLSDPDAAPVFWLTVAHTAWKLGRPVERATSEALRVIATGADMHRWPLDRERRKRDTVLQRLAAQLRAAPPPVKRVAKTFVAQNGWDVGEVIAYRLVSGSWTLFRVIGHHVDKSGRHAVCEALMWTGAAPPDPSRLAELFVRQPAPTWNTSQFLLGEPRRKHDSARFVRTGARSAPTQRPHGYMVFVFPYVDRQLRDVFGLE